MRILLVEDEPNAARMLAKGLREEAYAVDVVGDGERALELAQSNDYDLIILDVMLPRKDGFQVCQDLRAAGCAVPVMMLTARDATVAIHCKRRRSTLTTFWMKWRVPALCLLQAKM